MFRAGHPPHGCTGSTSNPGTPVDEDEACLAHIKGACDGTTRDCVFATPGTARRRSMRVLLNRLNNNLALTADEAQLLTRHVAAVISDANDGRKRAEQAEELLSIANDTSNRAEAARAERAQQGRDQHAAVLTDVLRSFRHETHPGRRCLQSDHVPVEEVERWRSIIAPTVERPWWEQVDTARAELAAAQDRISQLETDYATVAGWLNEAAERADGAEAAIERVRAIKRAPTRSDVNTLANAQDNGWDAALFEVQRALDGTEQQFEEMRENAEQLTGWVDEQVAKTRAAEEDALRATRRESIRIILDRATRGIALRSDESALLRQHFDAETREHDTARSVAAGNKRHGSGCVQCGIVWPCPTYKAINDPQPQEANPT